MFHLSVYNKRHIKSMLIMVSVANLIPYISWEYNALIWTRYVHTLTQLLFTNFSLRRTIATITINRYIARNIVYNQLLHNWNSRLPNKHLKKFHQNSLFAIIIHILVYRFPSPSNEFSSGSSGTVTGDASTRTGGANPTSRAIDIRSFHSKAPEMHSPTNAT